MNRMIPYFLLLTLSLLLSACAGSSVLKSYPAQLKPVRSEIAQGEFAQAEKALEAGIRSKDKVLYLMEEGRVAQVAGDFEKSRGDFNQAIAAITEHQAKAMYTVTGGAQEASAVLINDNVIPYYGALYEHALLHQYQALNYLADNNLEGALVEVRRSDALQKKAQAQHRTALLKANTLAGKHKIDVSGALKASQLREMKNAVSDVKASFENAFVYYLSSILHEATGEFNDAYIDIKKAFELAPDNLFLQKTVLRLAHRLQREDDLRHFDKLFHVQVPELVEDAGRLIVIFDQGLIPAKREFDLAVPLAVGITKITLPYYSAKRSKVIPLGVTLGSKKTLRQTQFLASFHKLAMKNLSEHMPAILVREVLRQTSRAAFQYSAHKKHDFGAALMGGVYNLVFSAADLRSWLTLPDNVQILQDAAVAGDYAVALNFQGLVKTSHVTIRAGKITLLWVTGVRGHLFVHSFLL